MWLLNIAALKRLVVRKHIWLIQLQVTQTHLFMNVFVYVMYLCITSFNIALISQVGKCCSEHSLFTNTSLFLASKLAAGQ